MTDKAPLILVISKDKDVDCHGSESALARHFLHAVECSQAVIVQRSDQLSDTCALFVVTPEMSLDCSAGIHPSASWCAILLSFGKNEERQKCCCHWLLFHGSILHCHRICKGDSQVALDARFDLSQFLDPVADFLTFAASMAD